MEIDVTGLIIVPSKNGESCPGNGRQLDKYGHRIECCCDECDYLRMCFPDIS